MGLVPHPRPTPILRPDTHRLHRRGHRQLFSEGRRRPCDETTGPRAKSPALTSTRSR